MTYDEFIFRTPADDHPPCDICDADEGDCTCAEDEALEHGDYLLEQMKDPTR